jgi:hypothetical protein
MEKLYRIEGFSTTGWGPMAETDFKLTKEQAKQRLEHYLSEGISPDRLRAVPDNG